MCLITPVRTPTFQTFFRSCGFLYGGASPFGRPKAVHHASLPDGHHGGGIPLSNGYLRCCGLQCCIKAESNEPRVASWRSIKLCWFLDPLLLALLSIEFSASYFTIAAGPFLSNFTFSFHQALMLSDAPLTGLPLSGMIP
uniref:Uncharacterized protein n=1 Tax=Arundo donax TaxID=35708 RepID=A0A0A9CTT0_ARUDO